MALNKKRKVGIELAEISEVLTSAMSKSVEVNVTTAIVADLDCLEKKRSQLSLFTQINLLDNRINREIDLKLIDNPAYGELQRWHIEQVKQRQADLVTNFANLAQMQRLVNR